MQSHHTVLVIFAMCTVCLPGDIRLGGGSVPNEGRVEICSNNAWSTTCDDGFDENDANVAVSYTHLTLPTIYSV